MLGRETPLSFHTFLESPVHTEDLVTNTAPASHQSQQQNKSCKSWSQYIKIVHGPLTGVVTGGFLIILGIVLVFLRWVSTGYRQLPMDDLYGPVLLVVAGVVCVITGFSFGLVGDKGEQECQESPVAGQPARAIQRRVETVTMRTRMDEEKEMARRESREAVYVTRIESCGSRRGSGVIIQVTQPSPAHSPTQDTQDRRHSLESQEVVSLAGSEPGKLCSPELVKHIPASRRTSLHGEESQENMVLVLGGGDTEYGREGQVGEPRTGAEGRRGSLTNWSKAAVVNRSFEMD